MSPAEIAAKDPQRAAYVIAETGQVVTYAELEADANRGAQFFRSLGLQRGDHIALLLENHPDFFKICWAAQRSGLYSQRSVGGYSRQRLSTSLTIAKRECLSRLATDVRL